jgi:hypothetical protein
MLIVTEDDGGSTSESLHIWKENRHLFGVFTEARVYSRGDGALIDGRLFKKHRLASPPSMILVDDRGADMSAPDPGGLRPSCMRKASGTIQRPWSTIAL